MKIWEAARATSAASTLFEPISIGGPQVGVNLVDAALGWNNPLPLLWSEARSIWNKDTNGCKLEDALCQIISIGTGSSLPRALDENLFEVFETLKDIVTETERTETTFSRDHDDLVKEDRYFRLNVAQGLEDVGVEEHDKSKLIHEATLRYGNGRWVQSALKKIKENYKTRGNGASPGNTTSTLLLTESESTV